MVEVSGRTPPDVLEYREVVVAACSLIISRIDLRLMLHDVAGEEHNDKRRVSSTGNLNGDYEQQ